MVSIISYILAPFLVQTSMSSLSCCVFCHMTAWQDCLTAMQLHELTCLWNVAQERQLHLPTGTTLTCPWADTWALQTTYKCVHIDTLSCTYAHIYPYTLTCPQHAHTCPQHALVHSVHSMHMDCANVHVHSNPLVHSYVHTHSRIPNCIYRHSHMHTWIPYTCICNCISIGMHICLCILRHSPVQYVKVHAYKYTQLYPNSFRVLGSDKM